MRINTLKSTKRSTAESRFESVFIIGYGDIGHRVGRLWRSEDAEVVAISRQPRADDGIKTQAADLDEPHSLQGLDVKDALIYYFAPPPSQGRSDPRMANFLTAMEHAPRPRRIVAISTTGIYGDHQGGWVTEETPPNPQVDRAFRRLDAETKLRAWGEAHGVDVVILRVGGIYGPERLPLARIKAGTPVLLEALAPKTNRIHADDLARVCVAAAKKAPGPRIYNVSDGQDSNMTEYFFTLADFFGLPHPPTVAWDEAEKSISKGMLSYLRESRRMDTRLMQKELGVTLQYPDLLSGLKAIKETV